MPEIKTQIEIGRNLSEFLKSLRLREHRPGLGLRRSISTSTLSEAANPTFTISLKEFIFPERNRNEIIALDFGRKTGFSSNAARKLMRAFIGSIAKRTNSRDLTSFEKNNDLLSGGVRNSANGRNAAAFASLYPRRSSEADGPRKSVQRSRPAAFRYKTQTPRKSFLFSEGAPSGGMGPAPAKQPPRIPSTTSEEKDCASAVMPKGITFAYEKFRRGSFLFQRDPKPAGTS